MEWNKKAIANTLLIVCGGVLLFAILQNMSSVLAGAGFVLHLFAPFFLGGAIAFILNVPMKAIEKALPDGMRAKKGKPGLKRLVAMLLTFVVLIGILVVAGAVIGPGIADAVGSIIAQLPDALDRTKGWISQLEGYLPILQEALASLELDWESIGESVASTAKTVGSSILASSSSIIGKIVSGVGTFAIAFVFSIYILLQKENLGTQAKQVTYALLSPKHADTAVRIAQLSSRTFANFLSGQVLEACILGTLFVISMSIFRMPYAPLIGVLISITALIPIVGAFIGCAVGALLIAVTNPLQAIGFIVLFLVLQQIEGNFIYPRVVGNSVGLPSIWVLAAVVLGGNIMGVAGMLIFIPLCSVLYALFRGFVKKRLTDKDVPPEKWQAKGSGKSEDGLPSLSITEDQTPNDFDSSSEADPEPKSKIVSIRPDSDSER